MKTENTNNACGASLSDAGFGTAADDLAMFASQIREFSEGQGTLPHPWRIDDWLSDYRGLFARAEGVGVE